MSGSHSDTLSLHAYLVASVVSYSLWTRTLQAPLFKGILQARILEWAVMPSSSRCSPPRDQTHVSCLWHWEASSLPLVLPGKLRHYQTRFTLYYVGKFNFIEVYFLWASLVAQLVKNPPAMRETWVRSLGWEDPLEKRKATHSSILA